MTYDMVQKLSDFYKQHTYESETGTPYYELLKTYLKSEVVSNGKTKKNICAYYECYMS